MTAAITTINRRTRNTAPTTIPAIAPDDIPFDAPVDCLPVAEGGTPADEDPEGALPVVGGRDGMVSEGLASSELKSMLLP